MISEPLAIGDVIVSRETMEKLEKLAALIEKWTKSINLIAPKSVPDIWDRHIVDSAQIYKCAPKNWTHWLDIGSGGGLPGLVIAILDQDRRPMTLVESDKRKCLFLSNARRELGLDVKIVNDRIENISAPDTDVLTARALAPLSDLLVFANELLVPDGTALFPKGARYQDELDQAMQAWQFDVKTHESLTNPDSRVLEISRIRRREP
ncbi:MAG: 16S rRNA (guanine(527)-N(7))-methyltransferase RsmG [Octadecabacter sp.]